VFAFFLSCNARIHQQYSNLFGADDEHNANNNTFFKHWGWHYSSKLVADHENISLDSAYKLKIVHYLNTLAYLKDYNKYQNSLHKKWQMDQRLRT
jgi:hypothetical protein